MVLDDGDNEYEDCTILLRPNIFTTLTFTIHDLMTRFVSLPMATLAKALEWLDELRER